MRTDLEAAIPEAMEPREREHLLAEIDAQLDLAFANPNFPLHAPGRLVLEICRDLALAPDIWRFSKDDLLDAGYFDSDPVTPEPLPAPITIHPPPSG